MLSSATLPEEQDYEIASPLLGERNTTTNFNITSSAASDGGDANARVLAGLDGVSSSNNNSSGGGGNGGSTNNNTMDPRLVVRNPILRAIALRCANMSSAADALPTLFYTIVTEGKITTMVMAGAYLVFLALWIPFWLLSFALTEYGVYALAVATVFWLGRSVLRMIAFPGASIRVRREIEGEFAKYSVQMLVAAIEATAELALVLWQATGTPEELANANAGGRRTAARLADLPNLWTRAQLYRNRVLAVYSEVLQALYKESIATTATNNGHNIHIPIHSNGANNTSTSGSAHLNQYGNNRLLGDIGNVMDLTLEAQADGRDLMQGLQTLLTLMDSLEQQAFPLLSSASPVANPNPAVAEAAKKVMHACRDMRDFCARLRPAGANENENSGSDDNLDDGRSPSMGQQFSGGGALEAMMSGLSSILPMLDPSPHTSIFGLDVQRGCMMSRYHGARQIWVRRPSGGFIDVLHFPALSAGGLPLQGNQKAVLYCNPNAGLIEVAGGMSLVGGNLPNSDQGSQGETWIDFYTDIGFDVFVFNYAGYGRSWGKTHCSSVPPWSRSHAPGVLPRLYRIVTSCFCHFQPTPDTLRADGLAVAEHLLNEVGTQTLIIHGESIGGVAASGTARKLSHLSAARSKLSLLICDRTFCNLEAVAQRLVGGWTGYAIRTLTLFAWSTDVAGDFLAAACPKIVANDAADAMISDEASLKSGIALWREIHRGIATTKGIAWQREVPLRYRMAEFENVCVNDSRYVAGNFLQAKAPTWPNDKHVTVEEVFHFAACCKRIGKLATSRMRSFAQSQGLEVNLNGVAAPSRPLVVEAWKYLSTCDGLTGSTLGFAVKRGFDGTVAWLCTCLVFGGQTLIESAEKRDGEIAIIPEDFDTRPPGYTVQERDGVVFPKPIPEVVERLAYFAASQNEEIKSLSHEIQFVVGTLQYVQARLSAPPMVESAQQTRRLRIVDGNVGCFLNLHCGHNSAYETDEKAKLASLIERATVASEPAVQEIV